MRASGGNRVEWTDVPSSVRAEIEATLGARVTAAVNQPGGFSPGLAARCSLEDGRRVFLKAVSPDQNAQAARIHRREAEVADRLPAAVPAPRLVHVHDDGHWVVLAFEEVDGRQPHEPWSLADLDRVVPAIVELGTVTLPADHGLQTVARRHRPVFDGWRRLAAGDHPAGPLDPWTTRNLETLASIEAGWPSAAAGDALVHADLRADNLLIRRDGRIVFVDWPWACVGSAAVDLAFFLPSVGLGDGPDPGTVIDRYSLLDIVDERALITLVVAVSGFMQRSAYDAAPPGLPNLRSFQQAQADVAVRWLRAVL